MKSQLLKEIIESIKEGDELSKFELAYVYEKGMDVNQDFHKSAELYIKYAKEGNPFALFRIGELALAAGKNTDAFKLFEASANKGLSEAQHNLGVMYLNGIGTKKNIEKARFYLRLSADDGDKSSKQILKSIDKK